MPGGDTEPSGPTRVWTVVRLRFLGVHRVNTSGSTGYCTAERVMCNSGGRSLGLRGLSGLRGGRGCSRRGGASLRRWSRGPSRRGSRGCHRNRSRCRGRSRPFVARGDGTVLVLVLQRRLRLGLDDVISTRRTTPTGRMTRMMAEARGALCPLLVEVDKTSSAARPSLSESRFLSDETSRARPSSSVRCRSTTRGSWR